MVTSARILIVEDHPDMAAAIGCTVEQAGFEVVGPVDSTVESLRSLYADEFDLAILDINLDGERIDPVVIRCIEQHRPFLLCTALSKEDIPQRYQDQPTLHKPFEAEDLIRRIQELLDATPPG